MSGDDHNEAAEARRGIDIGDAIRARTAQGDWLDAIATSTPEPTHIDGRMVHDFPVIRIRITGVDQEIPWPLTDVVLRGEVSS